MVTSMNVDEVCRDAATAPNSTAGERGSIMVPESRSDPGSRKIALSFLRYAATRRNASSPIIFLQGAKSKTVDEDPMGPRSPLLEELRQIADVFVLEPRGIGLSNAAPDCDTGCALPLTEPATRAALRSLYLDGLSRAEGFWQAKQVSWSDYSIREQAADVEELQRTLGAQKIRLIGEGSGAQIILTMLKRRLANVECVVLASPEGLDQTVKLPADVDAFLGRVQEVINRDSAAARLLPDIVGLMAGVHGRLAERPPTVTVRSGDGTPVAMSIGAFEVQLLAAFVIGDPEGLALVFHAYRAMDGGDYSLVGQLLYDNLRKNALVLQPVPIIRDILSGISAQRLAKVGAQAARAVHGDAMSFPMPHLRGGLSIPDLGDEFRGGVKTDVPTLLLTGTLDGWTYPEDHRDILRDFSDRRQILVVNGGYQLLNRSRLLAGRVATFMRGESLDQSAIELAAPKFVF
jgi:pimeloyl-ACP methyl ester carboxylesterase